MNPKVRLILIDQYLKYETVLHESISSLLGLNISLPHQVQILSLELNDIFCYKPDFDDLGAEDVWLKTHAAHQ
jgi:hypothetical protein